jgi:hypothetical protein
MLGKMIQFLGICLIVAALLDVFLTVLYARIGTGISTPCITRGVWWLFKRLCNLMPRWRDRILTFAAPVMLMLIAAIWVQAVIVGMALIIWPTLGHGVQAVQGPTPTDFVTAYYYSGDVLTTVGNGDLVARTRIYKLLTVFQSITGMCLITLTVTYLLEIYSALLRRNAFAVSLYHETSSTGDAVEKVIALGPHGDFEGARADLQNIANNLVDLYETHHFFWIVTYFRFAEAHYALSRILLVAMETVTIIRSALSEKRYRSLIHCGPVNEIWNSGMHVLTEFASVYLPHPPPETPTEDDRARDELWRRRYREVIMKLRGAGIETAEDPQAGEMQYISMRREWDRYIRGFARYMAHSMDEIDVALAHLKRGDVAHTEPAPARLRVAG